MRFGPYQGVVERVVDGDTIYVKLDVGFDLTVYARCRVYGINAPEVGTDAGKAAKLFALAVLPVGTPVKVVSHGWDKYGGRIDADIFYGNMFDNDFAAAMLTSNNAVPYEG